MEPRIGAFLTSLLLFIINFHILIQTFTAACSPILNIFEFGDRQPYSGHKYGDDYSTYNKYVRICHNRLPIIAF